MKEDLRLPEPASGEKEGRETALARPSSDNGVRPPLVRKRERTARQTKLLHIFEMVLLCALGFWLILHPGQSLKTAVRILGIGLLAGGALAIGFFCFSKQKQDLRIIGGLILGIAGVAAGLFVLIKPTWVINIFPMAAGIFVAFSGILNMVHALETRKAGNRGWQILLGLSVVSIVVGILLFANPFSYMSTLVRLLGAILIYNGVLGVIAAVQE